MSRSKKYGKNKNRDTFDEESLPPCSCFSCDLSRKSQLEGMQIQTNVSRFKKRAEKSNRDTFSSSHRHGCRINAHCTEAQVTLRCRDSRSWKPRPIRRNHGNACGTKAYRRKAYQGTPTEVPACATLRGIAAHFAYEQSTGLFISRLSAGNAPLQRFLELELEES